MREKNKTIPINYNDFPFIVEMKLTRDHTRSSYEEPPAPVEMEVEDISLFGVSAMSILSDEVKGIITKEAEGFASWD